MTTFRLLVLILISSCTFNSTKHSEEYNEIERIVIALSGDHMEGRASFSPGIERAAKFIENEFKVIGLTPIQGEESFRQLFPIRKYRTDNQLVVINGRQLPDNEIVAITDLQEVVFNYPSDIEIVEIKAGQDFFNRYDAILKSKKKTLVLVDKIFADSFNELRIHINRGRLVLPGNEQSGAAIFVLGINEVKSIKVDITNQVESLSLYNIAGIIPGKSKQKELVIFSAHYDHIGVIAHKSYSNPIFTKLISFMKNDTIANGADDNASGVTAVIALAKHFKKLDNNERTLIFVTFTAEEVGGFGSQYFSKKLIPSDVIAMLNFEMIGKISKFGKNSAYITGDDKSDLRDILQRNLVGSDFKLHPDPYPEHNLFIKSDNANMAALGVPAHSISTNQFGVDKFFHTERDDYRTLDLSCIAATIKAVTIGTRSIVAGVDAPKRIALTP